MIDANLPQKLLERGFEPIPIAPREKYPTIKNWPTVDCSRLVLNWPSNHGIGLRTGPVVAMDIDVYNAEVVDQLVSLLRRRCSSDLLTRTGHPPKTLVPLICPGISTKISSNKWCGTKNGVINQVEILSYGQQFVAFGIHPDTGKPYEWDGDLLNHQLPTISLELVNIVFAQLDTLGAGRGWTNLTKAEHQAKKVLAARREICGDAPGAIYNRSVAIETVLEHYGWTHYRHHHWTRPGKTTGVSGSVFGDILWCFTSSTCLKENAPHDAFELVSRYEFGGDKSACARALRREVAA